MNERILGLDIGSVRIGVAISDPSGLIAKPLDYIENSGKKKVVSEIEKLIKEYDLKKIVVGLPLHLNGDFGESAEAAKALGDYLGRRFHIEIDYQDERMTTMQAEKLLQSGGVRREKRKEYIDSLSAVIILETYLIKNGGKNGFGNNFI